MNLIKKDYWLTVLIHSLGSLSAILISLIILRRFGLKLQGEVAYFRSWIDLASVIGQFGFFQAFSFYILHGKANEYQLKNFSFFYSVGSFIIILAVSLFLPLHSHSTFEQSFLASVTAAMTIYQALIRALSLAVCSVLKFLLITVSYPVSMLILFAIWPKEYSLNLFYALPISLFVSCIVSLMLYGRSYKLESNFFDIKGLFKYGFSTFLPVMILGSLPFILYKIMILRGMSVSDISLVSIAILILNSMLLPINMLQPILYRKWLKNEFISDAMKELLKFFVFGLLWILLYLSVFWMFSKSILYYFFGETFGNVRTLIEMFMGASFFMLASRLITIYLQAKQYNIQLTVVNFLRVATTLFAVFFYSSNIEGVTFFWVIGEIIGCVCLLVIFSLSIKKNLFKGYNS